MIIFFPRTGSAVQQRGASEAHEGVQTSQEEEEA